MDAAVEPRPLRLLNLMALFLGPGAIGFGGGMAVVALFLPAMALMTVLAQFYSRLKDLSRAQDLLAGLSPVVAGLILGASVLLGKGAIHGWPGPALAVMALALLVRFKWHPAFVLGLGALAGGLGLIR